jgi:hypothetical protein
MSDQEVAEAANYVRGAWTNRAPSNATPGGAADIRRNTHTMMAGGACAAPDPAFSSPSSGLTPLLAGITESNALDRVAPIIAKAKAASPAADRAALVNGLTGAYCPIVTADSHIPAERKTEQLAIFSQLVYSRLAQPRERW